jgi:hypothetical protein
MLSPSVCQVLSPTSRSYLGSFFRMQVVIHAVLTTRIVLNIRSARNNYGEMSVLHIGYPGMSARQRGSVPDEDAKVEATEAIALGPLHYNTD